MTSPSRADLEAMVQALQEEVGNLGLALATLVRQLQPGDGEPVFIYDTALKETRDLWDMQMGHVTGEANGGAARVFLCVPRKPEPMVKRAAEVPE